MSEQNPNIVIKHEQRALQLATQSTVIQATAESEEIKCLFLAAQQWKRDEEAAKDKIKKMCADLACAEEALYSYVKGGSLIEGPSIDLIEDIKQSWGRIRAGWRAVESTDTQTTIYCYAIDYQELNKSERTIIVPHSAYGKALKDERDIYEWYANKAQRRMRSCIEALIPTQVIKMAVAQVYETLKNADKRPREERIKALLDAFSEMGVNRAMIEKRFNIRAESMSLTMLVKARAIFKSLKDGAPLRTFFDLSLQRPSETTGSRLAEPETKHEDKKSRSTKTREQKAKEVVEQPETQTSEAIATVTQSEIVISEILINEVTNKQETLIEPETAPVQQEAGPIFDESAEDWNMG